MANDAVTIIVHPTWTEVRQSIVKPDGSRTKSRLYWIAPGLEIYVWGAIPQTRYDDVAHHAMQQCLDRHIPLISMRRYQK